MYIVQFYLFIKKLFGRVPLSTFRPWSCIWKLKYTLYKVLKMSNSKNFTKAYHATDKLSSYTKAIFEPKKSKIHWKSIAREWVHQCVSVCVYVRNRSNFLRMKLENLVEPLLNVLNLRELQHRLRIYPSVFAKPITSTTFIC